MCKHACNNLKIINDRVFKIRKIKTTLIFTFISIFLTCSKLAIICAMMSGDEAYFTCRKCRVDVKMTYITIVLISNYSNKLLKQFK